MYKVGVLAENPDRANQVADLLASRGDKVEVATCTRETMEDFDHIVEFSEVPIVWDPETSNWSAPLTETALPLAMLYPDTLTDDDLDSCYGSLVFCAGLHLQPLANVDGPYVVKCSQPEYAGILLTQF